MDNYTITLEALRDLTKKRDQKRDAYADSLSALIDQAREADACKEIKVAGHRIAVETISGDCSQWSNRMDYPDTQGTALLIDRQYSFGCVPTVGFFDGHNHQHQRGPTRCHGNRVKPAPVHILADIGRVLPEVLAHAIADCTDTLAAQCATLDDLHAQHRADAYDAK